VGEGIAELLDSAEDIINAAAPDILAQVEAERIERERRSNSGIKGFLKRFGKKR
jgi:hypothetical protein